LYGKIGQFYLAKNDLEKAANLSGVYGISDAHKKAQDGLNKIKGELSYWENTKIKSDNYDVYISKSRPRLKKLPQVVVFYMKGFYQAQEFAIDCKRNIYTNNVEILLDGSISISYSVKEDWNFISSTFMTSLRDYVCR
jgi:hypothetical protein